MLNLNILADDSDLWTKHPTFDNALENQDVGLDIPMSVYVTVPENARSFTIDLGFKCESSHGWMLIPRSSICKTSLRLSNSVGIIDKSYRGKVMAKVDNLSDKPVILEKSKCYFQIVSFDGNLPNFFIVSEINTSLRGSGGFGSTT